VDEISEVVAALAALPALVDRLEALVGQAQQAEQQRYFNVKQAAEYTGLSEDTLRSAIKTGVLPVHKRGDRSLVLYREELDAYMGGRT
jgi:excisionase family DNA binding protein